MGGRIMLKVNHLSFSYSKNNNVIDDVSFSLKEGQINVLLGPNGIGKSTILKCLNGILKPKEGEIEILNRKIKEYKGKQLAKTIAYVEQSPHIDNLNVYETILLGRTPYITFAPTKEDKEIVNKVIREIGLEDLLHRNISSLSGGERQKVMIALALASNSRILLLDEPTANLDIKNALMIMNLIKSLTKKENLTVLISMHDISLAYHYGDYFLCMKDKKIKYSLDKKDLNSGVLEEIYDVKIKLENNIVSLMEEKKDEK